MLLCNYELRVYYKASGGPIDEAEADAKTESIQKQVEKMVELLRQDETITVTLTEV